MFRQLWLVLVTAGLLLPAPAPVLAGSGTLRVATFNTDLSRRNPGHLVRDLLSGDDPDILAVAEIIQRVRPDILLLNGIDHDTQAIALGLFRDALRQGRNGAQGIDYPYFFTAPVNAGEASGIDLDADGSTAAAGDAFGFGYFPGQDGMAILSLHPIDPAASRTFRLFRWADLPNARLPVWPDGTPWPDAQARQLMRLSSRAHWDVVVNTPGGELHLLALHATTPVFDGDEDANGLRNHDEIAFWQRYLDGSVQLDDQGRVAPRSGRHFVVLGDLNSDPRDGDSRHGAIRELLASDLLSDPAPASLGGLLASELQVGANVGQKGDPSLDTVDWPDGPGQPGNLRVDYLLPSRSLTVRQSGVFWPPPEDPLHRLLPSGEEPGAAHRLVWSDLSFQ